MDRCGSWSSMRAVLSVRNEGLTWPRVRAVGFGGEQVVSPGLQ